MGIQETFAENVRAYRKRAGLSQEKLGELCGVHRTYIGSIEQQRTNITLNVLEKLADALDVDPALLLMRPHSTELADFKRRIEDPDYLDGLGPYMRKGGYAFCEWTDDGIEIRPIRVYDEDLSFRLINILIEAGHADDLLEAYEERLDMVMRVFKSRREKAFMRIVERLEEEGV